MLLKQRTAAPWWNPAVILVLYTQCKQQTNRNQRSSKSKRKQIRHLLRVSREVVGASPARRRSCGTARTWWIDYSFHPGLDHLVKKKDSGGFLKLPPQWPRPALDILWYFIAGQDGGWLKNWFPKTSNCVRCSANNHLHVSREAVQRPKRASNGVKLSWLCNITVNK